MRGCFILRISSLLPLPSVTRSSVTFPKYVWILYEHFLAWSSAGNIPFFSDLHCWCLGFLIQSAERTLDAPELLDDYYLNLLDWSSKNVVSIALGNTVYLWHATSGAIEELMQVGENQGPVTSVNWGPDGKHIAVGLDNGEVQLWDSTALCKVRTMKGHIGRVGSLAWNGGPILSSGSRDNTIFNHDGE